MLPNPIWSNGFVEIRFQNQLSQSRSSFMFHTMSSLTQRLF